MTKPGIATTPTFCSICTGTLRIGFSMQALGKNNALVAVCSECSDEQPVERVGPRANSNPEPGGGLSMAELRDRKRVRMSSKPETKGPRKPPGRPRAGSLCKAVPDGHVLVRAPIRVLGRTFDHHEALTRLRADRSNAAWIDEAVYLGSSTKFHMFARPSPVPLTVVVQKLAELAAKR